MKSIKLLLGLAIATTSFAKQDIIIDTPPVGSEGALTLSKACRGKTYYDLMHNVLAAKIEKAGVGSKAFAEEKDLTAGKSAAVKLDDDNYNFHVAYPHSAQGGRSYGWTKGQVGDWSDVTYLNNLAQIISLDDAELATFYQTIIEMLGNCNTSKLANLSDDMAMRVATNFLAIYTAEQYRAIMGTKNWDDAILQVTLLGAFHGGQTTLTKFYRNQFSEKAPDQDQCVYFNGEKSPLRFARMNDYWQLGRTATLVVDQKTGKKRCKGRSGINITRTDFLALGRAITAAKADSRSLAAVQAIVGKSPNVFAAISQYFVAGKADAAKTEQLAKAASKFLLEVRRDADKITEELKAN